MGTGTSYPSCGDITTVSIRCIGDNPNCDEIRHIPHDCHRLYCPICYPRELWRRSGEAYSRLDFVKKSYYLKGIDTEYVEIIIYPPKDKKEYCFGTQEGYEWFKNQIKAVHNDYGILGGVQVTHITAVNRYRGATYAEYEKYRKGEKSEIRYNPHVQEIALRRADWGRCRDKERKWTSAGWFVRVLYADGRTENQPWKSVRKKIAYEMGHAYIGYSENGTRKQFTTWFGICAYNNVRRKVEIRERPDYCQCGLQKWLFWEDERREPAVIKERTYTYWLTDKAIDRAILKYELVRGPGRAETIDELVMILGGN